MSALRPSAQRLQRLWALRQQSRSYAAHPLPTSASDIAASTQPDFSFVPSGRNHLFVPGPVNIHENVIRAMSVPGQNHRDPWFAPFYKKLVNDTRYIYQTKEATPFIFPGTGTGGWEAALTNTLSPGDKIITFRYGQFSHLWVDMMTRLGLDVTVIDRPWGEGAHEGLLEEALRKDTGKKIKAVAVVHNETATGVTSDIAGVRAAMDAAGHPALLLVDGVSSIGALPFKMDEWRVDVAVTGSQKAMSLPTGLAFVAASPKALACMPSASRWCRAHTFSMPSAIAMFIDSRSPYSSGSTGVYGTPPTVCDCIMSLKS